MDVRIAYAEACRCAVVNLESCKSEYSKLRSRDYSSSQRSIAILFINSSGGQGNETKYEAADNLEISIVANPRAYVGGSADLATVNTEHALDGATYWKA